MFFDRYKERSISGRSGNEKDARKRMAVAYASRAGVAAVVRLL